MPIYKYDRHYNMIQEAGFEYVTETGEPCMIVGCNLNEDGSITMYNFDNFGPVLEDKISTKRDLHLTSPKDERFIHVAQDKADHNGVRIKVTYKDSPKNINFVNGRGDYVEIYKANKQSEPTSVEARSTNTMPNKELKIFYGLIEDNFDLLSIGLHDNSKNRYIERAFITDTNARNAGYIVTRDPKTGVGSFYKKNNKGEYELDHTEKLGG